MKLGFSLKKSKKKPLLAAAAAAAGEKAGGAFEGAVPASLAPEKRFVTDFDPSAPAVGTDGKAALVIPLIAANEWRGAAEGEEPAAKDLPNDTDDKLGASTSSESAGNASGGEVTVSADEAAARALIAEARGGRAADSAGSASSTLVIPLNGASVGAEAADGRPERAEDAARAEKKAALFQDAAQRQRKAGEKPILQQNAVPGVDKLADVKEKYQRDISLRPDELDVHSEAYAAVPIEEFGAAMLRGMGWKGSADKDEVADAAAPKPRHKLLGLGATMRPPLAGDKGKRKKKHQSRAKKDDPPPPSERRAGMNRADNESDKRHRSDSRGRQERDSSRDKDSQKRRRREDDGRQDTQRDRSRSSDRRDSRDHRDTTRRSDDRDRRDGDRKSDSRRDSRDRHNGRKSDSRRHSRDRSDDDRKGSDRRRRERSRSGDRDRHRSSHR